MIIPFHRKRENRSSVWNWMLRSIFVDFRDDDSISFFLPQMLRFLINWHKEKTRSVGHTVISTWHFLFERLCAPSTYSGRFHPLVCTTNRRIKKHPDKTMIAIFLSFLCLSHLSFFSPFRPILRECNREFENRFWLDDFAISPSLRSISTRTQPPTWQSIGLLTTKPFKKDKKK